MDDFTLKDKLTIPTYDDPRDMRSAELHFDPDKCKQCGICIQICPGGCLRTDTLQKKDFMEGRAKVKDSGVPYLDSIKPGVALCIACFDCGTACPEGAISVKHNFNPRYYYKRISQTSDMEPPKRY